MHEGPAPSAWVRRFVPLVPGGAPALDLACGSGRNTRLLLESGHPVTAIDIDVSNVADLAGRSFGGVVVTNYLHRPLLEGLVAAVAPGGVLIYETFCEGNEALGNRVTNPDFLLRHGELLELARGRLRVVAYEDVVVAEPKPAAIQRICAVRPAG